MTDRAALQALLDAYDASMAGDCIDFQRREMAHSVAIAGCFAAAAYDAAIEGGGDVHALTRAFLVALIDPASPELDYLRQDPKSGEVARDAIVTLQALMATEG